MNNKPHKDHPAYKSWERYRLINGYIKRQDSWYVGWLAFVAGFEAGQIYK